MANSVTHYRYEAYTWLRGVVRDQRNRRHLSRRTPLTPHHIDSWLSLSEPLEGRKPGAALRSSTGSANVQGRTSRGDGRMSQGRKPEEQPSIKSGMENSGREHAGQVSARYCDNRGTQRIDGPHGKAGFGNSEDARIARRRVWREGVGSTLQCDPRNHPGYSAEENLEGGVISPTR